MKHTISIALFLSLAACTSPRSVIFNVESEQPAIVEVGGIAVCDSTPCEIELKCMKSSFDASEAPYLSIVDVQAVPMRTGGKKRDVAYSQNKRVNPCQIESGKRGTLKFNMSLVPVSPVEQQNITIRHEKGE